MKCLLRFSLLLLLGYSLHGQTSTTEERQEVAFLSRFATQTVGWKSHEMTTVEQVARDVFNQATTNHIRYATRSTLPEALIPTQLLLKTLASPAETDQLQLFELSKALSHLCGILTTNNTWVPYPTLTQHLHTLQMLAFQNPQWGSVPPALITESQTILASYHAYAQLRISSSLPGETGSFESSYLEWTTDQKETLTAYQDSLEDSGLFESSKDSAQFFTQRYITLKSTLQEASPLRVIRYTQKDTTKRVAVHQALLDSIESLFIPSQLIDWAQMLDACNRQDWTLASQKLDALNSHPDIDPPASPISASPRRSILSSLTHAIYWLTIVATLIFAVLFIGGVNRTYFLAIGSALLAVVFKSLAAKMGSIIGLQSLGSTEAISYAVALGLTSLICSVVLPSRRGSGTALFLFLVIIILTPLGSILSFHSAESQFSTFLLSTSLNTGICGLCIILIRITLLLKKTPIAHLRFRSIDQITYPWILTAIFLLTLSLYSTFLIWGRLPDVSSSMLLLFMLLVIITAQLIRYLILRWTNSLKLSKSIMILVSCTFLLMLAVGVSSNLFPLQHYANQATPQLDRPVLFQLTGLSGIVTLFVSYTASNPIWGWLKKLHSKNQPQPPG